jgi:hypothetical protein
LICSAIAIVAVAAVCLRRSFVRALKGDHLKRIEEISRENARRANQAPMTKEYAEQISRRST